MEVNNQEILTMSDVSNSNKNNNTINLQVQPVWWQVQVKVLQITTTKMKPLAMKMNMHVQVLQKFQSHTKSFPVMTLSIRTKEIKVHYGQCQQATDLWISQY